MDFEKSLPTKGQTHEHNERGDALEIIRNSGLPESVVFEALGIDYETPKPESSEDAIGNLEKYKSNPECKEFRLALSILLTSGKLEDKKTVIDYTTVETREYQAAVELIIANMTASDTYLLKDVMLNGDQREKLDRKSEQILTPALEAAQSFEDMQAVILHCEILDSPLLGNAIQKGLSLSNNDYGNMLWLTQHAHIKSPELKEVIKKIAELKK
jgi:hypothetical protein